MNEASMTFPLLLGPPPPGPLRLGFGFAATAATAVAADANSSPRRESLPRRAASVSLVAISMASALAAGRVSAKSALAQYSLTQHPE
jgi:hypothetical protein